MRGKGFWQSYFFLLLDVVNGNPNLFLYENNMVIWFGEGIQGVKWLENTSYLVNSTKIHVILYFLQFLGVNAS